MLPEHPIDSRLRLSEIVELGEMFGLAVKCVLIVRRAAIPDEQHGCMKLYARKREREREREKEIERKKGLHAGSCIKACMQTFNSLSLSLSSSLSRSLSLAGVTRREGSIEIRGISSAGVASFRFACGDR